MAPDPVDPLDPHRTAALRRAVLQTWTASTARFREDANAEELLARGYADRVLMELAANAVDAARSAGVRAVLAVERIDLTGGAVEIRVANTGSPLTSDGVRALASLRASAKRDTASTIGHFGVGFTAVRALSDEPALLSMSGSVRFSAERTAEEVAALGIPELDAELRRRDGVLPALRLCWPLPDATEDDVPQGFSSQVRLPLRPGVDADAVLDGWRSAVLDELWWALPALDEVRLPDLTITRERDEPRTARGSPVLVRREQLLETGPAATAARRSFLTAESHGELPAALLADRPVEERMRADWRLCWSLPEPPGEAGGAVGAFDPFAERGTDAETVHAIGAPTATDDLLTLPARLVGTFPVDETRRRITVEPLTDHLLALSVDAYLALAMALPPEARWDLVPPQDFPAGDLDARLRALVVRRLADAPLLVGVLGDPVEPRTARCCPELDGATAAAVAEAIPALVEVPVSARTAARMLGVTMLSLSEAVDALSSVVRPPRWWAQLYRGLAGSDADALSGLPVPLADGRQVIGARGVLLPTPALQELTQAVTAVLPAIRWVAAEAADDLLLRIGAVPADPDAILASSALRAEITALAGDLEADLLEVIVLPDTATPDADDLAHDPAVAAGALAALVLDLIAAGGVPDPQLVSDLVLGTEDEEPWPATELLLPDATLGAVLVADALPLIGRAWVQRWGAAVLERAGVRAGLLVVPLDDPRADKLLPDLDDYPGSGELGSPDRDDGELGVADLDLVDDWPAFLALLDADPEARAAVLTRPGTRSYTGWWIAEHASIDGVAPDRFRTADTPSAGSPLQLLPPLPTALSPQVAAAIGVIGSDEQFAALVDDDPQGVLDRFCDPAVALDPAAVTAVVALLVARLADDDSVQLPDRIRVCDGSVRSADEVIVPDGPWWAQCLAPSRVLATRNDAELAAEVFGLPLAAADGALTSSAASQATSGAAEKIPAVVALLGPDHRTPQVAATLTVRDPDGVEHRVAWWPVGASAICDSSELGLASALAWANGRWADRRRILAAIRGDDAGELLARVWD